VANSSAKKIYMKAAKLGNEIQNLFGSLSLKINQMSLLFGELGEIYKKLELSTKPVFTVQSFAELEKQQKSQIGKEKDQSCLSQNYMILKTRLFSWSEQYKTSAI